MLNKTNILVIFILFTIGCVNLPETTAEHVEDSPTATIDIDATVMAMFEASNSNETVKKAPPADTQVNITSTNAEQAVSVNTGATIEALRKELLGVSEVETSNNDSIKSEISDVTVIESQQASPTRELFIPTLQPTPVPTYTLYPTYTPYPTPAIVALPTPSLVPTPTSIPGPPTLAPYPTSTPLPPTPTPIPVYANLSIQSTGNFPGTPFDPWEYSNCFDLALVNSNSVPITFKYVLKALDSNGLNYAGSFTDTIRHDYVKINKLLPGDTFSDMKCWSSDHSNDIVRPVTQMTSTVSYLSATEGLPSASENWDKIGDGAGGLENFVSILSEPNEPDNYPIWQAGSQMMYSDAFTGSWLVGNLSENKVIQVKTCTAFKWKNASHFQGTSFQRTSNNPNTYYDIRCTDHSVNPKATRTIGLPYTSTSGSQALYAVNLYKEVLGLWARFAD